MRQLVSDVQDTLFGLVSIGNNVDNPDVSGLTR
jgi:hypothetical protein